MNEKQALSAARTRWGGRAHICQRRKPDSVLGHTHRVGYIGGGFFFMIQGSGLNWAEAIEDADRKRKRDRAEYAKYREES